MSGANFGMKTKSKHHDDKVIVILGEHKQNSLLNISQEDKEVISDFAIEFKKIPPSKRREHCYTLAETADITGLSRQTVSILFGEGILPGFRLGKINSRIFIYHESLHWWLDTHLNFEVKEEKEAVAI